MKKVFAVFRPAVFRPAAFGLLLSGCGDSYEWHQKITVEVEVLPDDIDIQDWKDAGFYAVAYELEGETIISYRGTDFAPNSGNDFHRRAGFATLPAPFIPTAQ